MSGVKAGVIAIAAAVVGALITLAVVHPAAKDADEQSKAPQRVTIENGEPTITLDAETQRKIGLTTAAVSVSSQQSEIDMFGTVVDVQELAAIANQIASARAQVQQANSKSEYDRAQVTRLRALNADNKNVSDRAVQEAVATLAADGANAASANASIQAAISSAMQKFGPVIAQSVESQSDLYRDLVTIRRVLLAFAMPAGVSPPQTLHIVAPASVDARFVSIAPRVDPRLQRPTYFYVASANSLSAGMNVTARYSTPMGVQGAIAPPGAIVSWQGKSWVYLRRDATHFTRREFGPLTLKEGDQVVTTGAQQLLSEEMRAQLHEE